MSKKQLKNRRLTGSDSRENSLVARRLRRFLVVSTGVFGVVLLIVSSIYFGARSVRNAVDRPVAKVSVESDFNYVHRQDIMYLINNTLQQNFLYENLHAVKTQLEKNNRKCPK